MITRIELFATTVTVVCWAMKVAGSGELSAVLAASVTWVEVASLASVSMFTPLLVFTLRLPAAAVWVTPVAVTEIFAVDSYVGLTRCTPARPPTTPITIPRIRAGQPRRSSFCQDTPWCVWFSPASATEEATSPRVVVSTGAHESRPCCQIASSLDGQGQAHESAHTSGTSRPTSDANL